MRLKNSRELLVEVGSTALCTLGFWLIVVLIYLESHGVAFFREYRYVKIDGVVNSFYRTKSMPIMELLCKGMVLVSVTQMALALVSWCYNLNLMKVITPVWVLCGLGILAQCFLNPTGLEEHLLFLMLGMAAGMVMVVMVNIPIGRKLFLWICSLAIIVAWLSLAVGIFNKVGGNGSWLFKGSVQPGEAFKVGSLLLTIWGFDRVRTDRVARIFYFVTIGSMLASLLVAGDIGNAVILAAILLICLVTLGYLRLCVLVSTGGCGAAVLLFRILSNLKPNSRIVSRIRQSLFTPLFHLEDNAVNQNLRQGLLALVRGGIRGTGTSGRNPLVAANTYAAQTDFVLITSTSIYGFGFAVCALGALAVLAINVSRSLKRYGVKNADVHRATILASVLLIQGVVHTLGSISLLPMTGVIYPFLSSGGSSILSCYVCAGALLGYHLPTSVRRRIAAPFMEIRERMNRIEKGSRAAAQAASKAEAVEAP